MPIKTEEEAYEKIIDISRNNEYTTGNLLDYDYFKKHYKLIAIDLSKQQAANVFLIISLLLSIIILTYIRSLFYILFYYL